MMGSSHPLCRLLSPAGRSLCLQQSCVCIAPPELPHPHYKVFPPSLVQCGHMARVRLQSSPFPRKPFQWWNTSLILFYSQACAFSGFVAQITCLAHPAVTHVVASSHCERLLEQRVLPVRSLVSRPRWAHCAGWWVESLKILNFFFGGMHTDELTKVTCQGAGGCLLLYCMAVITPIGALMALPLALSPILPR